MSLQRPKGIKTKSFSIYQQITSLLYNVKSTTQHDPPFYKQINIKVNNINNYRKTNIQPLQEYTDINEWILDIKKIHRYFWEKHKVHQKVVNTEY